eukprot:1683437-Pleurochrysis_carterae.AAC.2
MNPTCASGLSSRANPAESSDRASLWCLASTGESRISSPSWTSTHDSDSPEGPVEGTAASAPSAALPVGLLRGADAPGAPVPTPQLLPRLELE